MKTLEEYEILANRRILAKYPEGMSFPISEITQTMTQMIMIDLGNMLAKKK